MNFKIPNFSSKSFMALSNWAMDKFKIKEFWKYSKGEKIRICVLDSGIPKHKDLIINTVLSKNYIHHETPDDHYNHATGVVGLLNAQLNVSDVDGICPEAEIICLKVLDSNGGGDIYDITQALKDCIFLNPDIINLSFGTNGYISDEFDNLLKILKDRGCFIVCASGNKGIERLDYPASSKHCISIGAIEDTNNISKFSSYGEDLEFTMPGTNLYTTCCNDRYCYFTGTSFACPIFSGILALYLSHLKNTNSLYTVDNVIEELKKCSIDLGPTGKDSMYGWGSVDLNCLFKLSHFQNLPKIGWFKKFINKIKWRFF